MWVRADPASAATVRHRVTDSLIGMRVAPETIADAALVATELVGNAIRHAAALPDGGLCVDWDLTADGVLVRVTDGGADGRPRLLNPTATSRGGRGLIIVAALADRWGVDDVDDGVAVWAHLPIRQDMPSAR